MNSELQKECFNTADKIINILDELGYNTEKVPPYPNLLRDLIAIEVKRNVCNITDMFYHNVMNIRSIANDEADVKERIQEGGCCGDGCGCHEEELPPPDGFDDPANPRND